MPGSVRFGVILLALAAVAAAVSLYLQHLESQQAAEADATALTGGNIKAGRAAISRYGCGGCHKISGVPGADGQVGPELTGFTKRVEFAGRIQNDPADLIRWIREPQAIDPGNGMPDLGVSQKDGRDIAAYLYTLR